MSARRRTVRDRVAVAVAPTASVLCAVSTDSRASASGIFYNPDLLQELSVTWETAWDEAGPWAPLTALNASQFSEPESMGGHGKERLAHAIDAARVLDAEDGNRDFTDSELRVGVEAALRAP